MATLSLCVGRVGRLREEFALRVLSEITLASSTFSGTIMLASGTTLISHFGVSFADAGERSAEISLQIRVIEQIPNTHFTVSAYSDDPGLLTLPPPPAVRTYASEPSLRPAHESNYSS